MPMPDSMLSLVLAPLISFSLLVGTSAGAASAPAVEVVQTPGSPENEEPLETMQEEGEDLLEALQTFTVERRDELVEAAEAEFVLLDEQIGGLRRRLLDGWQEMDESARGRATESLRAIERSRGELAQWLERARTSTRPGWEQMKEGFGEAYAGLVEMIRAMPAPDRPR